MRPWFAILIGLTGALLCAAIAYAAFHFAGGTYEPLVPDGTELHAPILGNVPEQPTRIQFVGDIMLARAVERMMETYGADYPYIHTGFLDAPFVVGNFEAAVPEVHTPTPSMTMNFSVAPMYLPALSEAGFTHVSLANNHADDHGAAGYMNTTSELTRAGLEPFGHPYELGTTSVAYLRLAERTVAVIGIYAVVSVPDDATLAEVLEAASSESDMQIVYVHWGDEYELVHNAVQERLAHRLVALGADMIVGHHPHVVQDVELFEDVPIFYSLGNFIFDQYFSTDVQQGLAIDLAFDRDGSYAVSLLPISTEASRTAPRVLAGYERNVLLEALADRSSPALADGIRGGQLTFQLHEE